MKRIFLLSAIIFLFACNGYSAVTTIDGRISLDFYEDTQSGIANRWILDFTVNDVDGGVEATSFNFEFLNVYMDFDNQYNVLNTQFYHIGHTLEDAIPFLEIPLISSNMPVPVGTHFIFYALPDTRYMPDYNDTYEPVIDYFPVRVRGDMLGLRGPVYFSAPVPEPVGTSLFAFGAFLLRFLLKRK